MKKFEDLIENLIKYLEKEKPKSMVLEIDGGIRSTITSAICYEASLKTKIPFIGRSLPIKESADIRVCSKLVGLSFCSDFEEIDLTYPYSEFLRTLAIKEYKRNITTLDYSFIDYSGLEKTLDLQTELCNENIQARLRMLYLYNIAEVTKGKVISSKPRSNNQNPIGEDGDCYNPIYESGLMEDDEFMKLSCDIANKYQLVGEIDKVNSICMSQSLITKINKQND